MLLSSGYWVAEANAQSHRTCSAILITWEIHQKPVFRPWWGRLCADFLRHAQQNNEDIFLRFFWRILSYWIIDLWYESWLFIMEREQTILIPFIFKNLKGVRNIGTCPWSQPSGVKDRWIALCSKPTWSTQSVSRQWGLHYDFCLKTKIKTKMINKKIRI